MLRIMTVPDIDAARSAFFDLEISLNRLRDMATALVLMGGSVEDKSIGGAIETVAEDLVSPSTT